MELFEKRTDTIEKGREKIGEKIRRLENNIYQHKGNY